MANNADGWEGDGRSLLCETKTCHCVVIPKSFKVTTEVDRDLFLQTGQSN